MERTLIKRKENKRTGKVTEVYKTTGYSPIPKEDITPAKKIEKMPEHLKKKKGTPFLPGSAGTSPYHARRVEKGGELLRLKRK